MIKFTKSLRGCRKDTNMNITPDIPLHPNSVIFNQEAIESLINELTQKILADLETLDSLVIIGILRKGVPLAKRIAQRIKEITSVSVPIGAVSNILFRDDLKYPKGNIYLQGTTLIPFPVDGKTVLLVDDVLSAGRTTRAAIDEILQRGRPAKILLACLIDRGGREVPIQPNYCGWRPTVEAIPKNLWVSVKFKEIERVYECVLVEREQPSYDTTLLSKEITREESTINYDDLARVLYEPLNEWKHKDLIGLQYLTPSEIYIILNMTPHFLRFYTSPGVLKKLYLLSGKVVVHWFHEPSTRTYVSFDLAAKRLGADTISLSSSSSSEKKGETLHDTLSNLEAMKTDITIVRHRCSGVPQLLASKHSSHIINAGDGQHEHPTQGLLDLYTMIHHIRKLRNDPNADLKDVNVTIIGDIAHSRVARSNIWGLLHTGAKITLCGPITLLPKSFEQLGVKVTTSLKEALSNADIIYALRIQLERQAKGLFPSLREYIKLYRIDKESIKFAPKHAVVMHPGPINRDIELATEIADSERSLILTQVTHGVAVRMAVMHILANSNLKIQR